MTKPTKSDIPIFDRATALESVDGHFDILVELGELFLQQCPKLMAPIRDAARQLDAQSLEACAHTLKGVLAYFGATRTYQAVSRLEQLAVDRRTDALSDALIHLEREIERLESSLQQLVDENRAGPNAVRKTARR
jgi:HPt (histidine-containing phosphotransfer) domain-containing protein